MTTRRARSAKIAAALLATGLLAACGTDAGGGDSSAGPDYPVAVTVAVADAVAVEPSADVATNLLPDLVVDDLNDDNKVNLRNYGVGDRPILIWMWAPH